MYHAAEGHTSVIVMLNIFMTYF